MIYGIGAGVATVFGTSVLVLKSWPSGIYGRKCRCLPVQPAGLVAAPVPALCRDCALRVIPPGGRAPGGLSLGLLTHAISGHPVGPWMWWWKIVCVGITLGLGMSGGIITPFFVIGAPCGSMVAGFLGHPLADRAEIGMMAVGANAPIAAVLMGDGDFRQPFGPEFPDRSRSGLYHDWQSQRGSEPTGAAPKFLPWVPIRLGTALDDAPDPPLLLPWTRKRAGEDRLSQAHHQTVGSTGEADEAFRVSRSRRDDP